MSLTLILILSLLLIVAIVGKRISQLPNNIWLLFLAQPLAMCSTSIVVLAGGLIGAKMAPKPELATLPLALMILGTAVAVIPASLLMKHIGRRRGTIFGLMLAVIGALTVCFAAIKDIFELLLVGTFLLGMNMAFVAQMRFAAIESLADVSLMPKAIAVLMASGLFAAMLGPEVAVTAVDWIDSPYGFAGSFFALAILLMLAILIISRLEPTTIIDHHTDKSARKLSSIVKQPLFIIAISSSTIAYAVMSYVMTASPLSMHELHSYDLQSIKWVVQGHILGMYLPSLIAAMLLKKLGIKRLMIMGCSLYVLVVLVALTGHSVMHYWWAMVLLGIGWNFLFMSGTLLLPEVYQANERFKVQAINDFGIFFIQAIASLSAGVILFSQGWRTLISITIPVILIMFIITIWYYRLTVKDSNRLQNGKIYEE